MYKGVLRDDERRREKLRQREEDLRVSQHKREWYEQVQKVKKASDVWRFLAGSQYHLLPSFPWSWLDNLSH